MFSLPRKQVNNLAQALNVSLPKPADFKPQKPASKTSGQPPKKSATMQAKTKV